MHTTPTKLKLLKAMKICDILNSIYQGITDDFCYQSLHLTDLKTV